MTIKEMSEILGLKFLVAANVHQYIYNFNGQLHIYIYIYMYISFSINTNIIYIYIQNTEHTYIGKYIISNSSSLSLSLSLHGCWLDPEIVI